jgi:hypothetical protein
MDPVPDLLHLRKSRSAGNRTRTSGSVARNSDHWATEAAWKQTLLTPNPACQEDQTGSDLLFKAEDKDSFLGDAHGLVVLSRELYGFAAGNDSATERVYLHEMNPSLSVPTTHSSVQPGCLRTTCGREHLDQLESH